MKSDYYSHKIRINVFYLVIFIFFNLVFLVSLRVNAAELIIDEYNSSNQIVKSYDTLQKAFNEATNGNTLKLVGDVNECVTLGSSRKLTLDLNGNNIWCTIETGTIDDPNFTLSAITNDGELYVKNGEIIAKIEKYTVHKKAKIYGILNRGKLFGEDIKVYVERKMPMLETGVTVPQTPDYYKYGYGYGIYNEGNLEVESLDMDVYEWYRAYGVYSTSSNQIKIINALIDVETLFASWSNIISGSAYGAYVKNALMDDVRIRVEGISCEAVGVFIDGEGTFTSVEISVKSWPSDAIGVSVSSSNAVVDVVDTDISVTACGNWFLDNKNKCLNTVSGAGLKNKAGVVRINGGTITVANRVENSSYGIFAEGGTTEFISGNIVAFDSLVFHGIVIDGSKNAKFVLGKKDNEMNKNTPLVRGGVKIDGNGSVDGSDLNKLDLHWYDGIVYSGKYREGTIYWPTNWACYFGDDFKTKDCAEIFDKTEDNHYIFQTATEAYLVNQKDAVELRTKSGTLLGKYNLLQEAIDAASNGDVIVLMQDLYAEKELRINKDLTIDLNGKILHSSQVVYVSVPLIFMEDGTLTIKGEGEIVAFQGRMFMGNKNTQIVLTEGITFTSRETDGEILGYFNNDGLIIMTGLGTTCEVVGEDYLNNDILIYEVKVVRIESDVIFNNYSINKIKRMSSWGSELPFDDWQVVLNHSKLKNSSSFLVNFVGDRANPSLKCELGETKTVCTIEAWKIKDFDIKGIRIYHSYEDENGVKRQDLLLSESIDLNEGEITGEIENFNAVVEKEEYTMEATGTPNIKIDVADGSANSFNASSPELLQDIREVLFGEDWNVVFSTLTIEVGEVVACDQTLVDKTYQCRELSIKGTYNETYKPNPSISVLNVNGSIMMSGVNLEEDSSNGNSNNSGNTNEDNGLRVSPIENDVELYRGNGVVITVSEGGKITMAYTNGYQELNIKASVCSSYVDKKVACKSFSSTEKKFTVDGDNQAGSGAKDIHLGNYFSKGEIVKVVIIYNGAERETYVKVVNTKSDESQSEFMKLIKGDVIPVLMILLGLAALVTIVVLGTKIVKSSDSPSERSEYVKQLRNILFGLGMAILLLFALDPVTEFVKKILVK